MIIIGILVVILTLVLYFFCIQKFIDTAIVQWAMVNSHSQKHKEGRAKDISDKNLSSSEFSKFLDVYC